MNYEKKRRIKKLFSISLIKTLRFNLHYFRLRGMVLPVIVYKNVKLSCCGGGITVSDFRTGIVQLGPCNVGIKDAKDERGIWENNGNVTFEGRCIIGSGSKISCGDNATLVFGDDFRASATCEIICWEKIEIEKNVLISWDCLLMDTDFHQIMNSQGIKQRKTKPILIGEHCWIGCRSVILKGSALSDNTIVAANSTITKAVTKPNSIIGENGRTLKENVEWTSR